MRTITIWEHTITLDLPNAGEELRVRHIAKIQMIWEFEKGKETSQIVKMIAILSDNEEKTTQIIENLTISEFTQLNTEFSAIMDSVKKKELKK